MSQPFPETPQPVRLSLGYKVIWGLAALGTSLVSGTYGALLPIFYQDYLGLSARWIGIVSVVYAVWNALNDPLFGYITDSTRSRRGRRIPYMRYTAPFLALTFILVWMAPRQASPVALFGWMLVTMLLYDTCYTIIGLVYSALLPEVSESDVERHHLQISASLFGLLGFLIGFIVPEMFRPKAGSSPSFLPLQVAMVVLGVASALLILATTLKVRERPEFYRVDQPLPLGAAVRYTFTSKSFLILVSQNFMSILMQSLVTGMLFYLADYVLNMSALPLLAAVFLPLFIGVPVTAFIRRRLGVVGTQQLLLLVAGTALALITVVPNALIPLCLAVAGFGLAGPQTLTNVLFAQVADEDELRSGVRREGAFFGVNALLTKPAQSIALALIAFVLDATGFIPREATGGMMAPQPPSAIFGIKALAGLIPGLALILGAFLLQWFPLRGGYLAEVQERVLRLHAEKHARL
ncbi:MAG: MFS transporter [Anaerolineae bacterium]|nr:MFS transporter [Anaerolineae bacterium]MCX8066567.1 MFS transporter [Anaerolineae bacterium]